MLATEGWIGMPEIVLSTLHKETFDKDGFVTVENVLSSSEIEAARARFEPLFRGEFETGIKPDEWTGAEGESDPALTRQICNGWRADRTIASIVLHVKTSAEHAHCCVGWSGRADQSGQRHLEAARLEAARVSSGRKLSTMECTRRDDDLLDHTRRYVSQGGTIEYVRGSHLWPLSGAIEQFHAPDDPTADLRQAAENRRHEAGIRPD